MDIQKKAISIVWVVCLGLAFFGLPSFRMPFGLETSGSKGILQNEASGAVPPASFSDLVEKVNPAVVNVTSSRLVTGQLFPRPFGPSDPFREFFERFFGGPVPREFRQRSLGSGFIIRKDGLILTNNHVIEGAEKIQVVLSSHERADARVIGRDAKTDIALIKIDVKKDLPVAALGDSDRLKVGDWVVAVGNPFGLGHTVTAGIVSAKGRVIGAGPYDDFIQTDASINPGNSGGPLFNLNGEVVGINTAIVETAQGIGFAIPINMAKEILNQLEARGAVVRAWLGVTIQKVTPELASAFGLKADDGALVSGVVPAGPADKAGLKTGDVIIQFNNSSIREMNDLPRLVANSPVGKEALVKVIREGKTYTFKVILGEQPKEEVALTPPATGSLGITLAEITPELARRYELEDTRGLVVTQVTPGSPADEAQIQAGDVILEVERKSVATLTDFEKAFQQSRGKENILLLVKNKRGSRFALVRSAKG